MDRKLCFVVQGFSTKTDFKTGRNLDLDKSYQVIKEAVEEAGLRCVRADEIQHSGPIDKPMYENLLRADLVIADLSTYNVNAAFELGVRYAMRPYATLVVAEEGFDNPFDVSHMVIRRYKHLGEDIGVTEARRFKKALGDAIRQIVGDAAVDSPVYIFIPGLVPPSEARAAARAFAAPQEAAPHDASAKELMDKAMAALDTEKFAEAKTWLAAVHALRPHDDTIVQKLALATYKSKAPSPEAALREALALLDKLQPKVSNDPETLGLAGAVHKRLWDITKGQPHLDESIAAYERGYYLKGDYYTGINYAFVLNTRAALLEERGEVAQAIADFMAARKVRAAVMEMSRAAAQGAKSDEQKYWVLATALEAAVGLESAADEAALNAQLAAMPAKQWMRDTTGGQVAKLRELLKASPLRHLAGRG